MTFDVQDNVRRMVTVVSQCRPHEVVVFPEGAISGYSDDLSFLAQVDSGEVGQGLNMVWQKAATQYHVHLVVGAVREDGQGWRNQAWYLAPNGERQLYNKVNLATHERGTFVAGQELPVFTLQFPSTSLTVGVQLCREIRFPGQWRTLALKGAEAFIYMTHAVDDAVHRSVWRSHLISRAAENQRWLVASNAAHHAQLCPSMIIECAVKPLALAMGI